MPKPRLSAYLCQAVPQGSKAFGVYVTYVKTPSYFCIQVIGEDSTQALDSLHEDMAQYYNSKAGDKCSIDAPYVGQVKCISVIKALNLCSLVVLDLIMMATGIVQLYLVFLNQTL